MSKNNIDELLSELIALPKYTIIGANKDYINRKKSDKGDYILSEDIESLLIKYSKKKDTE